MQKATVFYDADGDATKAHAVEMSHYNSGWFAATIPGQDVNESGLKYWIVAEDQSGNRAATDLDKILVKPIETKTSFSVTCSVKTNLVEVVATKKGVTL